MAMTVPQYQRAAEAVKSALLIFFRGRSARTDIGNRPNALALATGVLLNWPATPIGYASGVAKGYFEPEHLGYAVQKVVCGRGAAADYRQGKLYIMPR